MNSNTVVPTDKNLSENDPTKKLYGVVIGTASRDGTITRGRLIKFDDRELWLEKITGDVVMIARPCIDRIWISKDCQKVSQ